MWTETTDSFLRITQFWKETFAVNDVWGDDTSRQSDEEERNHQARQSTNIKMARINKNLKQC